MQSCPFSLGEHRNGALHANATTTAAFRAAIPSEVGWVERSETQQQSLQNKPILLASAALLPSLRSYPAYGARPAFAPFSEPLWRV